MNSSQFDSQQFRNYVYPTLIWLKRSIEATDLNGSSAYFSRIRLPLKGWEKAYPETTGYIIETLLDYHQILRENWLLEYALKCTDWLCQIQMKNGAFMGLYANSNKPSTFNTGQIIFGLVRAFEETQNEKYFSAFRNATLWLSNSLSKNGSWKKGTYVNDYIPSYNTRVVWAMLYANRHLNDSNIEQNARLALDFYLKKIRQNGTIEDWSFERNQPAFTHTIAYTIRGFLESEILLNEINLGSNFVLSPNYKAVEILAHIWQEKKRFAGTYDENWNGNYSFVCVTGNAQISIIFSRLFQLTNSEKWNTFSKEINLQLSNYQRKSIFKNLNGGIPGSSPIWGKYMWFKYPNWAAKFYLDAWSNVTEFSKVAIP